MQRFFFLIFRIGGGGEEHDLPLGPSWQPEWPLLAQLHILPTTPHSHIRGQRLRLSLRPHCPPGSQEAELECV